MKFVAPPKEMLLSFSIVWFLTNYDVINRKHKIDPIYSIVEKGIKKTRNRPMETTKIQDENPFLDRSKMTSRKLKLF